MEFSVSDIKKKFFIFSQKKAFLTFQETSYISGSNFLLSDKKKKKKNREKCVIFQQKMELFSPNLKKLIIFKEEFSKSENQTKSYSLELLPYYCIHH